MYEKVRKKLFGALGHCNLFPTFLMQWLKYAKPSTFQFCFQSDFSAAVYLLFLVYLAKYGCNGSLKLSGHIFNEANKNL